MECVMTRVLFESLVTLSSNLEVSLREQLKQPT